MKQCMPSDFVCHTTLIVILSGAKDLNFKIGTV